MKQKIWFVILLAGYFFLPTLAQATKSTYVYTDRRFQFIKRAEVDKDTLKERQMNQPYTFTELQLREMLSGIKFDKKALLDKNDDVEEDVFNQPSLDLLIPNLVKAFKEAQPNEEVVFSFVTHKPKILIRDDRLTIVRAWVEGNQLHLDFKKLMAKISNDYDKMSDVNIAMNKAQGVRVSVKLQPGQQFGKSTDEVLLNIPEAGAIAATTTTTENKIANPKQKEKPAQKKQTATATPPTTSGGKTNVTTSAPAKNPESRLQQLDSLKKKGLINKDEYQKKRQEILNSL